MGPFGQGTRGRRALGALLTCGFFSPATAVASLPSPGVSAGTLVANGSVRALAHADGTTYLGGDFTRLGPRTGAGAALDRDGALVAGFPEIAGGEVRSAVGDGAGGWYVGGDFTT